MALMPMKVFVVEDSLVVRERLVAMLQDIHDVQVVGEADSPADALSGIRSSQPDVVVLDIKLKGGSGIEVLRKLGPQTHPVTTIVLSNYANPEHRQQYLAAGASHFFDKTEEFEKIKDVLENLIAAGSHRQGSQRTPI